MTEKDIGFITIGSRQRAGDVPEIGIGMLGYAFMGKAHSNGFKKMAYIFWPPPAIPRLILLCGRTEEKVREEAKRYGYEGYTTDWHDLINDDRIQIFDNVGPNDIHAEPCIAAAHAGKHILCEKPMARSAEEAKKMLDAVQKAGVVHMVAHNYRLVPAIILAKNLIDDGKLGKLFHFRAVYLQEGIVDPNFPLTWRLDKKAAGSGVIGDLGSHIIDLARFLCGEPGTISAITKTFITERPLPNDPSKKARVEIDDAFAAVVEFTNGAIGTLESSRFSPGRKNYQFIEINGERGSMYFNLENMNYLHVYFKDEKPIETQGFHAVSVTESYHPYYDRWWPHGHIIGWENTFVHEVYHLVDAVINGTELSPMIATFEDGYRNAVICDAIMRSADTGRKVEIKYL